MLSFFLFYAVVSKVISNNNFLARQISLAIKWSILVLIKSAWLRVCSQEKKMKNLLLVASLVSVFGAASAMAAVMVSATA